jgi:hypothetical protein
LTRKGGQKKFKVRTTVVHSSNESDHNIEEGVPTNRGPDTEPEENTMDSETPEEEVGELSIMEKK